MTGDGVPTNTWAVAGRPAVFAHRGGRVGAPNTLDAVRSTIDAGADGVEIDIQVAAGGELVAKHDPGADLGAEDLPGLADLLTVTEEAGIRLLIDFKSAGDPGREAQLLDAVLADAGRPTSISVSSFSIPFLERFQELSPGFALYPIVSLRQNFPQPRDLGRWAGVSVLAAAVVVNPFLWLGVRRKKRLVFLWFGATEWSWLIRAAARLRADAVIVADVARSANLLGWTPTHGDEHSGTA